MGQMMNLSELKTALSYDSNTGIFTWLIRSNPTISVGQRAGTIHPIYGYRIISFKGIHYRSGRLAWLLTNGELPEEIDHINQNRSDDRISNLRPATRLQNVLNRAGWSSLGVKGVHLDRGRFVAQIRIGGKKTYLGRFHTIESASLVYRAAAKKEHGEFVNLKGRKS